MLQSPAPASESLVHEADAARLDFNHWHLYSLLANFATLALVTVAMALAAQLPGVEPPSPDTKIEKPEES